MLPECTYHDKPLASKSSLSLREVRFSEQEFPASKHISDFKHHHPRYQNQNFFHPFND